MRRSSHQEFWGFLSFRSLSPWFCRAPPRFVSGSEEQLAKSFSSRSHSRRRSHPVCVMCLISWRYILAPVVAVADCHACLTWKVLLVSAKKLGEGRRALPILFLATGQSDRQEGEAVSSLACSSRWCQDKSGGGGSDGIEFIGGGVLWR